MKKHTQEFFLEHMKQVNSDILVLGKYNGTLDTVLVECKKCGHQWNPRAAHLLEGRKCPNCARKKKTTKEFIDEISVLNPKVTILGEYINSKTPIRVKYNQCGHEKLASITSIRGGCGCPKCYGRDKSTEEFIEELAIKNPKVEVVGEYERAKKPILVKCKQCGNMWRAQASNLLLGTACPQCYGTPLKTNEQFIKELKELNPFIEVLDAYIDARTPVRFRCKNCEHIWKRSPNAILRRSNCPQCVAGFQSSFFEQLLFFSLIRIYGEGNVLNREKNIIGKELDIFIPERGIAIEYGSWFWHRNKVERDFEKYRLCKDKGIFLLTIYDYFDLKESDRLFEGNILVFTDEFGTERNNIIVLSDALRCIFERLGIQYIFSEDDIKQLKKDAEMSSRRRNTEDFVQEISIISPHIEVLGDYLYSHLPIDVKCKNCGHTWNPTAKDLLRGHGCPICRGSKKKTTEAFEQELKKHNADLDVVGEYKGTNAPILVSCRKCKFEWAPVAYRVLKNHGCPQCSGLKKGITRDTNSYERKTPKMRTTKEFVEDLREINSDIVVLDEYKGIHSKIEVQCLKCKHKWKSDASNLLAGHGCPKCKGTFKKNTDLFIKELIQINSNVEVIGEYTGARKKILVRCKICNHEWTPAAGSLLAGHGCPKRNRHRTLPID